ncbi:hypothetical protein F3W81_17950 [Pseudooceanicola spongiae]|uniref:Uncharacterized protein n=1 Tax=Pseudooceanicola spongiae TaxID=2613965 RepID=A0A7L9WSM1_9RHOB|nr:hypothetical protein F3W81_17950 [Pseudooceanicola spongiae]
MRTAPFIHDAAKVSFPPNVNSPYPRLAHREGRYRGSRLWRLSRPHKRRCCADRYDADQSGGCRSSGGG